MDFITVLRNTQELLVDKVYSGGRNGNSSDDPLNHLVGVSNQGGFRIIGSKIAPKLIVLSSNSKDNDWPDSLDKEQGVYTYYGDNKKPGHELHDTPRYGNLLLRDIFEKSHGNSIQRAFVPPILVFAKSGGFRDVQFLGLAVPGVQGPDYQSDLIAVWKLKNGKRFQNYQAKFTILNIQSVPMDWIKDIKAGNLFSKNCPKVWQKWVDTGIRDSLKAPRAIEYKTKSEQLPDDLGMHIINRVYSHFKINPIMFEVCAAKISELMLKNIVRIDLTRSTRDGGRDAIGKYRIGDTGSSVEVDFALEAKCYSIDHSVGVKEMSRLISRLKHRQFGIFVTTSYVALQAYQEIIEDEHPILIISAIDIVRILKDAGITSDIELNEWLLGIFDPVNGTTAIS